MKREWVDTFTALAITAAAVLAGIYIGRAVARLMPVRGPPS